MVLSNIRGDYFSNLPRFQKKTGAAAVDAGIVADDGQVFASFFPQRPDEVFRNTAEPEATQHDCGSIVYVGDRFPRVARDFIHDGPPRLNRLSISSKLPASIESRMR